MFDGFKDIVSHQIMSQGRYRGISAKAFIHTVCVLSARYEIWWLWTGCQSDVGSWPCFGIVTAVNHGRATDVVVSGVRSNHCYVLSTSLAVPTALCQTALQSEHMLPDIQQYLAIPT